MRRRRLSRGIAERRNRKHWCRFPLEKRYNNRMENTRIYDPREEIIEDFLEGQPRAAQWREYRVALQTRLDRAKDELVATAEKSPERREAEDRVKELRTQIRALAEEEAITQFVEESVGNSLTRPRPFPAFDDGDYDE